MIQQERNLKVNPRVGGRIIWGSAQSVTLYYSVLEKNLEFDSNLLILKSKLIPELRAWFRGTWYHLFCVICKRHAEEYLNKAPLQFQSSSTLSTSLRHFYNSVRDKLGLPHVSHEEWTRFAEEKKQDPAAGFAIEYVDEKSQETLLEVKVEPQNPTGFIPFTLPSQSSPPTDSGKALLLRVFPQWCKLVFIEHIWINLWGFEETQYSNEAQTQLKDWIISTVLMLFSDIATMPEEDLQNEFAKLSFVNHDQALETFLHFWNSHLRIFYANTNGVLPSPKTREIIRKEQELRVKATRCRLVYSTQEPERKKSEDKVKHQDATISKQQNYPLVEVLPMKQEPVFPSYYKWVFLCFFLFFLPLFS